MMVEETLGTINTSAARICAYFVRVMRLMVEKYTYTRNGQSKEGMTFKCFLVGNSSKEYFPAVLRGNKALEAVCQQCHQICASLSSPTNMQPSDGTSCATYIKPAYTVADSAQIQRWSAL